MSDVTEVSHGHLCLIHTCGLHDLTKACSHLQSLYLMVKANDVFNKDTLYYKALSKNFHHYYTDHSIEQYKMLIKNWSFNIFPAMSVLQQFQLCNFNIGYFLPFTTL